MFSPDFYRCSVCGKVTWIISGSPAPIICCGEPMTKLTAGESDGTSEKHITSVLHSATDAHHIEWIAQLKDNEINFRKIPAEEIPAAYFILSLETPVSTFAYCNIHGLWKTGYRDRLSFSLIIHINGRRKQRPFFIVYVID